MFPSSKTCSPGTWRGAPSRLFLSHHKCVSGGVERQSSDDAYHAQTFISQHVPLRPFLLAAQLWIAGFHQLSYFASMWFHGHGDFLFYVWARARAPWRPAGNPVPPARPHCTSWPLWSCTSPSPLRASHLACRAVNESATLCVSYCCVAVGCVRHQRSTDDAALSSSSSQQAGPPAVQGRGRLIHKTSVASRAPLKRTQGEFVLL